jgi:hypothetical protein
MQAESPRKLTATAAARENIPVMSTSRSFVKNNRRTVVLEDTGTGSGHVSFGGHGKFRLYVCLVSAATFIKASCQIPGLRVFARCALSLIC